MNEEDLHRNLANLKAKEKIVRDSFAKQRPEPEKNESPSPALRYTWLGAEFAAIFFGFVYGGHFLDQRFGTKPWLILLGICAGFGLALYRLIFVARRLGE